MDKNGKKYRRSGFSIACYVIAAALLVYICYLIGSTVNTINEYYAQYGMTAQPSEYFTYIMQTILEPCMNMIVIFMLGYILDAVRKNNPANYLSDEELEDARIAKKEAREAKKFAKGEAAAAKAGHVVTEESSVEADFAKSLDEELKADEEKASRKKSSRNYQNRQGVNKSGQAKKSGEGSSSKGEGQGNKSSRSNNGNRNSGGNNNARRNNNRKPAADKAKTEASKAEAEVREKEVKAADGFEAVVAEPKDNE